MGCSEPILPPGFRFHPTDEELILHYLKNRATSIPCPVSIIAEVDIYKFDPWDLPAKATFGDREWYFFSPRDRKYPNGVRPNRAAASGYWKATGTDKPILSSSGVKENIGVKKALVFYRGKPPRGIKTNWIMHEYRLAESPGGSNKIHHHVPMKNKDTSMRLDDWVLCRIYKKNNNQNVDTAPADREREDSNVEDNYLPSLPELTQRNYFKLPKSGSLSEFLEDGDYSVLSQLLYDHPNDVSGQDQKIGSLFSFSGMDQSQSSFQGNSQMPASVATNSSLKRSRTSEGYPEESGVLLQPSKRYTSSCTSISFNEKAETPQFNSSYFKQHLLLNPHLGLP